MKIGDRYKIESDSMNIVLYEEKTAKKTGNKYWLAIGYFGTVKGALKTLVDLEVAGTKLKDLKTVVDKQQELYDLIKTTSKEG